MIAILQISAAVYLAAAIAGAASWGLGSRATARAGLGLLGAGALIQTASFFVLHTADPVPHLTDLPMAVALVSWMVMIVYLLGAWRARLLGLVGVVAPIGFLGAFFAALRVPHGPSAGLATSGSWPHAHVLLASGSIAALAVAAIAGVVFLSEDRRLKRKRLHPRHDGVTLPSLEALDRVNAVSLAVGFVLLSLGVLTGIMWVSSAQGHVWTGSPHEMWMTLAWGIYALLVIARFGVRQGARDVALSAVAGFVFLAFAVVGVGMLA